MPGPVPRIGYGSTIAFGDGASPIENFTIVGEVVDLTPPAGSAESPETTYLQSPQKTKEYIGGAIDAGKMSFAIRWDPTDAGHKAVRAKLGVKGNWQIGYPDAAGNPGAATDTFAAVLMGFKPSQIAIGTVIMATIELQASGPITSTP